MIHSCNERQWYVDRYLVPSMLEQGINKDDIYIYQDKNRDGNLVSWVISCHKAYELWGDNVNVWHLQDDVLLASYFKSKTEELEATEGNKMICGFTCYYDDNRKAGYGTVIKDMWFSFPCIRLNTTRTKEFANWCDIYVWRDSQFGFWIRQKKGDDFVFRVFVESYYPNEEILNLNPNIIEHVDFLLGGTIVNKQRKKYDVRSMYWNEEYLVEELRDKLAMEE